MFGLGKLFSKDKKTSKKNLDKSLELSNNKFLSSINKFFSSSKKLDEDLLEELEEILLLCDINIDTTELLINKLKNNTKLKSSELKNNKEYIVDILKEEILEIISKSQNNLKQQEANQNSPNIILVIGVNGVGKTTTIGKLSKLYKDNGNKVIVGAADTFRAAAIDQIKLWGKKLGFPVISQEYGSDPASVAFNTVSSAIAKNFDVAIIDTSGRLHNNKKLMDELSKIKKAVVKASNSENMEVVLVLDATTGQNALEQAKQFSKVAHVSSLALTKLDGTAKGGVIISIAHQMNIPVRYIGIGESENDLVLFDANSYVNSLFKI